MKRRLPLGLLLVIVLLVLAAGVVIARSGPRRAPGAPSAARPTATLPAAAVPTLALGRKTSGCEYRTANNGALLPDIDCTPGAANPALTREVLCAPGFSTRQYRHVTDAQKRRAYSRYGIASHAAGEYEVDHLLAIEDGGANDDTNLWPEPASPAPGFRQKDVVETYVHRQVCAGALDLAEAQQQIASDWTSLLAVATHAGVAPKQHADDGDESD